jgi:acetyl esterase/lipase
MTGRILVCGEAESTAGVLADLLPQWELDAEVIVASSRDELRLEIGRGLRELDGLVVAPGDWSFLSEIAADVPDSSRIVIVGLDDAEPAESGASAVSGLPVVRGRGLDGFRWASAWLRQRLEYPFEQVAYGDHPDQIADLRLPPDTGQLAPVAVFIHGGFWRERWVRDTIEPAAIDLALRGFATLNIEYRRVRSGYAGWRETVGDVAAAIDQLSTYSDRLDLSRVAVLGHSAGAQLTAWAIKRRGVRGPSARVHPKAVVLLAGMTDLREAARRGLGDTGNPTIAFMGGTEAELGADYDAASPSTNLPLGVAQIVVQGMRDSPDLLEMARGYAEMSIHLGDPTEYIEVEDGDHFTVITPSRPEWEATVKAVRGVLEIHVPSTSP